LQVKLELPVDFLATLESKKIVIVKDIIKVHRDEEGIVTIGLLDFLQKSTSLDC